MLARFKLRGQVNVKRNNIAKPANKPSYIAHSELSNMQAPAQSVLAVDDGRFGKH